MDALPNAHAALLHFPIVLLPVAVGVECAALTMRSSTWMERLARLAWVVASAAVGFAFLAGRSAADGLLDVPPTAQLPLSAHADAAWWLLLGSGTVLTVRLASGWVGGRLGVGGRVVTLLGGIGLLAGLTVVADRGGALVYQHGLAVHLPPVSECPPCESTSSGGTAASRWTVAVDGAGTWAPLPGDVSGPESVVEVVGQVQEHGGGDTLRVSSTGRGLVLLPGVWSDVQLNATLDLSKFEGDVSVVHHSSSDQAGGAFQISTGGAARLLDGAPPEGKLLDEAAWGPTESAVVSVSAAGSHLKGLVDGRVITHGHAPAHPDGRVGLALEGVGSVGIRTFEVIPLGAHP